MPPAPPPVPGRIAPPPPAPRGVPSLQPPVAAARALFIRYQGQVFPVNKDRFIIGRGKQTSDLTIKDPNVSRQHALVEFANGQYVISDLGSTNGIEYQGQRVQRRTIMDGDLVKICDHELAFSFR
jgi:pSer/pThr/pTyr-binding forkhead associated (FHA) protein